ncbi:hypothetical protein BYT27DRAFT_7145369 [Phlegmacium glaucopus]|nr:hypothetical protein BYT27DRAFT_7145369 [Phlegmacium glaucopus]
MKFAIFTTLLFATGLSSASLLPRQSCPQATRFGVMTVTNPSGATSYNPGDSIHIKVDFTCAINTFGIVPEFIDFTIEVPPASNNGHEAPIVLARRTLAAGATSDEFTTQIPHAFFFAGAPYNVVLTDTYPTQGTDGSQVFLQSGVEEPITINVASS